MASSPDSGERTEQATERRMREVREKGQLSRSQDLTAWVGVGAAAVMVPATIERGANAAADQMFTVTDLARHPDTGRALAALADAFASLAGTLGPMLLVVVFSVLAAAAVQGGIRFKKFAPKFEQFNLGSGLKNVLGMQALWNGAKSLLKTAVVGLVLYTVVQQLVPVLLQSGGIPVSELLKTAGSGVVGLVQFAVAAGLVLAFADVFVVSRRNRKKTRMTKKEVKDENKSTEGDPLIKSQRRARQMAMSRSRMMGAVATADVVLVNPVHVAVALRYEPGKSAPRVVAKGADRMAARIREEAEAKKVPLVKDIPLARALHGACGLGEEIPVELYNQVAAVLAFVMALKKRGSAAGMHQIRPGGSQIPDSLVPRPRPAAQEPQASARRPDPPSPLPA